MFDAFLKKPNVDITIDDPPKRKRLKILNASGTPTRLPTLTSFENVTGSILITLPSTTFDHKGIKLELLGTIQSTKDQKDIMTFLSLTNELSSPGTLSTEKTTFPFQFTNVQKPYETYRGISKNVKYILRLTIDTRFRSLVYDQEFFVMNPQPITVLNNEDNKPIKMEVGIEDYLHLVFDVNNSHYGTKGILEGSVTFLKVGFRFRSMEVQIIRKEIGNGMNPESKVIVRYEIMDGGPIKNEVIPFLFYLKPYKLGPTMMNVGNKFSVQYFINLVLNDDQNRAYFKQHEIVLYRIEKQKRKKSEDKGNVMSG